MLPRSRSWSLPPSFGLRRRDASPVDRRRHRRSQSFSVREMDKVISLLDRYENQHETRLQKVNAYAIMLAAYLDTKQNVLSDLKVRFKEFMGDPQHDTQLKQEGLIRRGREMSKKIIEELSCERDDDVVNALRWMEEKEDEFLNKLENIRTMQMLSIRRKSANQS